MLDPGALSPVTLAEAMEQALAAPPPQTSARLNLDGADAVADRLIELAHTKELRR